MNKNDNTDNDEAYFQQFKFLKNSHNSASLGHKDTNVKEVPRLKGARTVDQLNNNNLDLTTGVRSVMEEDLQSNISDSLILRKTDAQKMIELPDMNKKMRTQLDYREALKGNPHPKKSIQDEITFKETNVDFILKKEDKTKSLYEEMKKNNLSPVDDKEIMRKNLVPDDQVDSKLKVYKVKKNKVIIPDNENKNIDKVPQIEEKIKNLDLDVTKSNRSFRSNIYMSSSLLIGAVFLLKLYKKLKK